MSLYDKYHSEHNKTYMYNLIKDIVLKETGFDITNNEVYKKKYNSNYSGIFQKINTDTIVDLNKELLDTHAELFINDINESKQGLDSTIQSESKVTDILLERDSQDKVFKNIDKVTNLFTIPTKKQKHIIISSLYRYFDLKSHSCYFLSKIKDGEKIEIHSVTISSDNVYPYIHLLCKINNEKYTYLLEYNKEIGNIHLYKSCEPINIIHNSKTILFEIKNHLSQKIYHNLSDYIKVVSIESKQKNMYLELSKPLPTTYTHISFNVDSSTTNKLIDHLRNTICKISDNKGVKIQCEWPHTLEIVTVTSPLYILPSYRQTTIHATSI